jgi:enoyl-[acyl-carrier-protein] reductase (NADH)
MIMPLRNADWAPNREIPVGKGLVSIEDVGAAPAFLAHDVARLITGDTIYIDGGYHLVD